MHSLRCKHKSWDIMKKTFSTTENIWKSHYESLGIHPNATQNDIKTAYYKLSKLYHPDKNKGSDVAADKFRDITSAYEVLGNLRTRRMYDKGIYYPAPDSSTETQDINVHTTDTYKHAKFYHSRNIPYQASSTKQKGTPIYDFDGWAQEHYGSTFAKRAKAKDKYDNLAKNNPNTQADDHQHRIIKLTIAITFCMMFLMHTTLSSNRDTVKSSVKK